ncbi:heptaprenylglyceryl phosphate synthase [Staphylospora marina]|uniref:heptaprenylglyceryl phosphate synthase n=1 Tax=Staphylospora marina TaxID=2490858 RepID=UPI000F5C0759|nr:heptaprenylglyceryl phosphate synthase [Staphylospora marina]
MLRELAAGWRHVFKLDPARPLSDEALRMIIRSGTDAIIVGGTDGVTFENTWQLLSRIRAEQPVTVVQEVSDASAVVPGFDGWLIPSVLNAGDPGWIIGEHLDAIGRYGDLIPWNRLLLLAYVVLNPDSKVGRLTRARTDIPPEGASAYARLVDRLFRWPVLYVEYSGRYGDPEWVREARRSLSDARLFYGGGITDERRAREMAALADTVVVGNLVYARPEEAVRTVGWVKETRRK